MTFTINLRPTEETRVEAGAKQSGKALEAFLKRLVTNHRSLEPRNTRKDAKWMQKKV